LDRRPYARANSHFSFICPATPGHLDNAVHATANEMKISILNQPGDGKRLLHVPEAGTYELGDEASLMLIIYLARPESLEWRSIRARKIEGEECPSPETPRD
jgi:hypothetical protein